MHLVEGLRYAIQRGARWFASRALVYAIHGQNWPRSIPEKEKHPLIRDYTQNPDTLFET